MSCYAVAKSKHSLDLANKAQDDIKTVRKKMSMDAVEMKKLTETIDALLEREELMKNTPSKAVADLKQSIKFCA